MEETFYDGLVAHTLSGKDHVDEQSQDHRKGKFPVAREIFVLNGWDNFRLVARKELFEEIEDF